MTGRDDMTTRVRQNLLGLYEKAIPLQLDWDQKFRISRENGYDYIELSIDATPPRLERLQWPAAQIDDLHRLFAKYSTRFYTMALTANRFYPLGDFDAAVRRRGVAIVKSGIDLAVKLGVRLIQIAAYDVYGKAGNAESHQNFIQSIRQCAAYAERNLVPLSLELMDIPYANTCDKLLQLIEQVDSPYLRIYYDIGNAAATEIDNAAQIKKGGKYIAAVHVKDAVVGNCRSIPYGEGVVDFDRCAATLEMIDYAGPIVSEMWSNDDPGFLPYLKEAALFIRKKFNLEGDSQCWKS